MSGLARSAPDTEPRVLDASYPRPERAQLPWLIALDAAPSNRDSAPPGRGTVAARPGASIASPLAPRCQPRALFSGPFGASAIHAQRTNPSRTMAPADASEMVRAKLFHEHLVGMGIAGVHGGTQALSRLARSPVSLTVRWSVRSVPFESVAAVESSGISSSRPRDVRPVVGDCMPVSGGPGLDARAHRSEARDLRVRARG